MYEMEEKGNLLPNLEKRWDIFCKTWKRDRKCLTNMEKMYKMFCQTWRRGKKCFAIPRKEGADV